MKKRLIALLAGTALAIGLFTACANDTATNDAPATETADEADATDGETADATGETFSVGITLQSLQNAYWAGVFGEVEKLLQERGWEYTILDSNDNAQTQISQIENFTSAGVDLIMVHPSDPVAIEESLRQAMDAGILVMSWDDELENSDLNWVLDNTELGKAIGLAAAGFISEHFDSSNIAQVAVMNYPQTPILADREQGILAGLEEGAPGLFEVVAAQPAIDAASAQTAMESILQAHPDLRIVVSIGAGGDIGANEAFMVHTGGDIPDDMGIFSADATEQQLEAIIQGQASRASVGFEGSNLRTAQAVVDLYARLLEGETFPGRVLVRPLTVINIDNAAEYLADY